MRVVEIARLKELFQLDIDSGRLTRKVAVGAARGGSDVGNLNSHGYLQVCVDYKQMQVHRIVFAIAYGYWPEEVDHRNGVRTDNRLANLREATRSANQQNKGVQRNSKSGVKGVYWEPRRNRWLAQCSTAEGKKHVGYFDAIEAAERAVAAFREHHHGEFARHA